MSNPRIQATRNESWIIGMSNPRIRATRNESEEILGHGLLGIGQERNHVIGHSL